MAVQHVRRRCLGLLPPARLLLRGEHRPDRLFVAQDTLACFRPWQPFLVVFGSERGVVLRGGLLIVRHSRITLAFLLRQTGVSLREFVVMAFRRFGRQLG
jgi:hypothetical protein